MPSSISFSSPITISRSDRAADLFSSSSSKPSYLRFLDLQQEALGLSPSKRPNSAQVLPSPPRPLHKRVSASLSGNGTPVKGFDYDLVIIKAGVSGHSAALHAVKKNNPMINCNTFTNSKGNVNMGNNQGGMHVNLINSQKKIEVETIDLRINPKIKYETFTNIKGNVNTGNNYGGMHVTNSEELRNKESNSTPKCTGEYQRTDSKNHIKALMQFENKGNYNFPRGIEHEMTISPHYNSEDEKLLTDFYHFRKNLNYGKTMAKMKKDGSN